MARDDHLPIWNDAMKLSVGIERAVMQFSRYQKYALGAELRRTAQAVLGGIVRAARASVFCRGKRGLLRYSEYPLTRHGEFSGTKRLLRDHEPRLCERSEAISFLSLRVMRLLHCVRNDEISAVVHGERRSIRHCERSEAISSVYNL